MLPAIATAPGVCTIGVAIVQPGTYEIVQCDPRYENRYVALDPPAPAANTTCATAATLGHVEAPVIDGQPRWYRVTLTATSNLTITAQYGTFDAGQFNLNVFAGCGGAKVGSALLNMCGPPQPATATFYGLAAGTYVVEASNVTPGADFTMSASITTVL